MTRFRLSALFALAICIAAGFAALALYPSPVEAQSVGACPPTLPGGATSTVCRCAGSDGSSAVWGTDVYTDDSNLCNAAVHAGAIPATGGIISVQAQPGRDSYFGSTRNGVTTRDYGRWGRSIVFEGAGTVSSAESVPLCPGVYNANGTGWSGTCRCTGVDAGSVWGTDVYTADSRLCRAARHAGVIGSGGGLVRVTAAPGQSRYTGTTRNGVTTSNWGSYGASFRVSR